MGLSLFCVSMLFFSKKENKVFSLKIKNAYVNWNLELQKTFRTSKSQINKPINISMTLFRFPQRFLEMILVILRKTFPQPLSVDLLVPGSNRDVREAFRNATAASRGGKKETPVQRNFFSHRPLPHLLLLFLLLGQEGVKKRIICWQNFSLCKTFEDTFYSQLFNLLYELFQQKAEEITVFENHSKCLNLNSPKLIIFSKFCAAHKVEYDFLGDFQRL